MSRWLCSGSEERINVHKRLSSDRAISRTGMSQQRTTADKGDYSVPEEDYSVKSPLGSFVSGTAIILAVVELEGWADCSNGDCAERAVGQWFRGGRDCGKTDRTAMVHHTAPKSWRLIVSHTGANRLTFPAN